jgi:acetylornithine deacetylase
MSKPDIHVKPKRLRRLLKRLLDIYSPSGKEEDVVDYLYGYMRRVGLPVQRQQVDENRHNLVVSLSGRESEVAFIGHIDTVPAYELEDFGAEEQGDMIKGLGAADMKAGCAAMIEAFACLQERGVTEAPVTLALVVGEEEKGDGAEALVREYHFPWAIIGEPTDLKPCLRHYGYLEIRLNTKGRRLHASMARKGGNAVAGMLRILLRLSRYLEQEHEDLIYNIRDLFSSGGGFVVPDGCEAWVDVHLPPSAPVSEISLQIEELISKERDVAPSIASSVHFTMVHSGYELPERGAVIEAMKAGFSEQGLAWEPLAFPSHSDANQLWMAGVKPIILGCGRLEKAHSPGEDVSFEQVIDAAEIYYRTAARIGTNEKRGSTVDGTDWSNLEKFGGEDVE